MSAITKPGVYDLSAEDYHADPVEGGSLSSTWARRLMEPAGPARFRHDRLNPPAPRAVFEHGHAAHALVLGIGAPLVVYPADKLAKNGAISTDEAKDFRDEARARGEIPLKQADYDRVVGMAEALQANPDAVDALRGTGGDAMHEVSAFRPDERTGMWLRARFDAVSLSGVADYKTTIDADPERFGRETAHKLGYHQQARWYLDMAEALGLIEPGAPFRFVLQEKEPPYLTSVVILDPLYLSIARSENERAIDLYAQCRESGIWPGFVGTTVVEPPRWLGDQSDQKLAADIEAELNAYANSLRKKDAP